MQYFLKLPRFEGPLDLLLHLIKVNELDIFDIDIFALTTQYLDFLRLMKFNNILEAASFIEMAACLVEIKSRKLLPDDKTKEAEEEGDVEQNLQERLIAYDLFQRVGQSFAEQTSQHCFTATSNEWQRLESLYAEEEAPVEGDPLTILVLYEQMLSTLNEKRPINVQAQLEKIPMNVIIDKIKNYLEKLECVLLQKMYNNLENRHELVANIIAMLQLVGAQEAKIYQNKLLGPIWLYANHVKEKQLAQKT